MRRSAIALAAVMVLALVPRAAHAQGYFVPFVGFDFGGDAGNCASFLNDCAEKRTTYGFAVGHLSHGLLGFEEVFSYAPDFFGKTPDLAANNVLTLMSNIVVAIPAGPVHPYLSGGVGVIRAKFGTGTVAELADFSKWGFGYNIGGGVMAMLPAHLGIRVDFRHMRSASDLGIAGVTLLNGSKLNFSKISVGLVLH